jgi:hypothetical protein
MTSSAPHDDWFLDALRRAGEDDCPPLRPDRLHDIAEARRMTPDQRMAALNEIMLFVEATPARTEPRTERSIDCRNLRL